MSRSRWSSRFRSLGVILLALGVALWLGLALTNRSAAADLARRRGALEDEIWRAQRAISAADRTVDAADRALAEMSPPKSRELPRQRLALDPVEVELISTQPKLGAAFLRSEEAYVKNEYAMFYRAQDLAPERIAQFEKNFLEYRQAMLDLNALFLRQGESEERATRALLSDAEWKYETGQGGLLGIKGYSALQEYQNRRYFRTALILPLAGVAALHGVPLTAEQGQQLLSTAIGTIQPVYRQQAPNEGAGFLNDIDWGDFRIRVRGVITSAQAELLLKVTIPSEVPTWRQYYLSKLISDGFEAERKAATTTAQNSPAP